MKKVEWEEKYVKPWISKSPERRKEFKTYSGFVVDRLYTPEDVQIDYDNKLSYPGIYPFTRGVYPTMYRGRIWTMRQYAGFGTAEETNKRYKYLLSQGQTGLSVAFDLPTQIGYDSDHPMALGEVGKVGVAISTLEDMQILFDGIPLDKVSTSMTINSTCAQILSMYVTIAEMQGVDRTQLRGTVQNDMLKEYIARGTYIFPPEPSLKLATDIIVFCAKEMPRWNSISISGYHMEEAGATPVQEVAFTLANGIAYVEKVLERGIDVDEFAPQLSFFFAAGNNLFEEAAKFRAARRLWARIMKERFNAKKPESMMLRFHVQTAGCTLTAQQPENNIIRVTLQALAAVLGGCQSLHTNSFDEALCLPTEKAVRIALRTQQVIAEESGVADVIDPLGGSYYVEWLTDKIEEEAEKYIEKIDEMGGMVKAIEKGWVQREIARAAYEKQKAIESGEITVVGVNKYVIDEEIEIELLRIPKEVVEKQIARLRKFRENRDKKKVEDSLYELKKAAEKDGVNLMPYILDAIKSRATLGETSNTLREVFGEFRAPEIF
ncbi:MAG: methylmalonyl-CoA mutase family protein [Archaeoglobaceae archaeon]|nr:methylmalonyl-CoA mutase family protein [Archaeoglobaceae archaeon]MCX8151537.1 methylmalonyl-CoA mutase family protein [Archaeoglobaceae archaeon]MDW8013227.1 methylmalonyl-CoA mutase family protein [Archaeoglobaceae archaeon]